MHRKQATGSAAISHAAATCMIVAALFVLATVPGVGNRSTFAAAPITEFVRIIDEVPSRRPELPVPDDANAFFYVRLSHNPSTVVYVARLRADGSIDSDDPVDAFWRRFGEDGRRDELGFFLRRFIFGISQTGADMAAGSITGHLVIYPERSGNLQLDEDGRPMAVTTMGSYRARLVYAYVDIDNSGMLPRVNFVDLFGIDLESGTALHERIRPDGRSAPSAGGDANDETTK